MATVTKDFKVKNGLIVEGTTGTINNYDILTKKADDNTYIVNLIGGTATSANEANKVVKRDAKYHLTVHKMFKFQQLLMQILQQMQKLLPQKAKQFQMLQQA